MRCWIQNQGSQKTSVTDSANNPLAQGTDQAPTDLDDLLASVRTSDEEKPKKRGRKKKEPPAKDFKAVLWASADKLRAQMDAAVYKHLVLGMIFLKYVSDAFAEQQQKVLELVSNPESDYYLGDDPADHQEALEDRDYYTQENVFWVLADARWESLRNQAKQPDIGQLIDRALVAIENENPTLRGKLDKRFGAAAGLTAENPLPLRLGLPTPHNLLSAKLRKPDPPSHSHSRLAHH